jgi:pimeloyl-ACP methyl ester carboxylesterase
MLLKDRTAVIYGGGGSIGGAAARAFAREGARVFLAGRTLATLESVAEDIRSRGGVAETAQLDALDETAVDAHADAVAAAAARLPRPVGLVGWSMGGLAVLQTAARVRPHSVVLIESSPPAEVQGFDYSVVPAPGSFDPEEVYGRFPPGMESRPESSLARAERKRGISVPALPWPSLVISGRDFSEERGTPIAELYGSDELKFPDFGHWDLVRESRVRSMLAAWLGVVANTVVDVR